MSFFFKKK